MLVWKLNRASGGCWGAQMQKITSFLTFLATFKGVLKSTLGERGGEKNFFKNFKTILGYEKKLRFYSVILEIN